MVEEREAWHALTEQQNSCCKEAPVTGGGGELPVLEAESELRCRRATLSLGRGPPASCSCGQLRASTGLWLHRPGLCLCGLLQGRSSLEQGPSQPCLSEPSLVWQPPSTLYQTHPFGPARGQVPPGQVS